MRHKPAGRWVIACINWSAPQPSSPTRNRAAWFTSGGYDVEIYVPTFADAWAKADELRERLAA